MRELLHSKSNEISFRLRNRMGWLGRPYAETSPLSTTSATEPELSESLPDPILRLPLHEDSLRKIAATLWILETMKLPRHALRILEGGSQDFQRLLAFDHFWPEGVVEGWELDPFPLLRGFSNRYERAKFYRSLCSRPHSYKGGDFFLLHSAEKADLGLAFYPFVSVDPALAWGLPSRYGNALAWAQSMARNVRPGGLALFVHQGEWEEEAFDEAREGAPALVLEKRLAFRTPFVREPFPAHASLYRIKDSY